MLFNRALAVIAAWVRGDEAPAALTEQEEWLRNEAAVEDTKRDDRERRRRRAAALRAEAEDCAALRSHWARPDLPEWLTEAAAHVGQWRSQGRLAGLTIRWRGERFAGDERIHTFLEIWRRADKHLFDWEASMRSRKTVGWRLNYYRNFAADLIRKYKTVVIPNTDWTTFLREKPVEQNGSGDDDLNINPRPASMAGVGVLITALKGACANVVEVPAKDITRRCHVCGHIDAFDARTELIHKCRHCPDSAPPWDQGRNACANMLATFSEGERGGRKAGKRSRAGSA